MSQFNSDKLNILNFDIPELEAIVLELGDKKFRAKQIFGWLAKGVEDWSEMTNVPANLLSKLEDRYYIGLPTVITEQHSKDGTVKCLYEFADGARVESVFMKYSYGNSICISSQVGCRMGCKFCASTLNGLERNLEAGEMLGEVLRMVRTTQEPIGHIVVMGIGEPFDNYEVLSKFLKLVHDEKGYNLGYRNITISTCGLIPKIKEFAEDFPQVNLAVSLHAPNDEIRRQTMPIANKYDYGSLLKACKEYTEKTGRRITFEYSMINGVNDSAANAEELSQQLKGWLTHVNLIPLNRVDEREFSPAANENIQRFKAVLEKHNIACSVRRTLGSDIDAACGQLRHRSNKT